MAQKDGMYKCELCGNIVSVIEAHDGELACCGQAMKLLIEKTGDEGLEKHVPVIEKTENGIKVKVGSVVHPMDEGHFIDLIQVISKDGVVTGKRLKPGDLPEAEFHCIESNTEDLKARALCNVHGLWTSK